MRLRLGLALLAIGAPAFPLAAAQPVETGADQTDVSQVGSPSSSVETPAAPAPAQSNTEAPTQLVNPSDARPSEAQLASTRPSAEPPQALSRPEQGRTAAVEHVDGHDRCDPATTSAKDKAKCADVIEKHADDYAAPEPEPLSAEQQLLIDMQYGHGAANALQATHSLATTGKAKDEVDSGVASVALQPTSPSAPGPTDKPNDTGLTQDQINAIVQLVNGAPPQ